MVNKSGHRALYARVDALERKARDIDWLEAKIRKQKKKIKKLISDRDEIVVEVKRLRVRLTEIEDGVPERLFAD